MAVFRIDTNPGPRQLRQFGLMCVVLLPVIAWFWGASSSTIQAAAVIGTGLGVLGVFAPKLLKPIFIGLVFVTFPIGLIVGEVILLAIFAGLFLPMALLFRIIGRDVLKRRLAVEAKTFWVPRSGPTNVRRYFRQY